MNYLIILAVIVYILYSQYSERAVKGKKYIIIPLILIFIGYMDIKGLKINTMHYLFVLIPLCIIFLIIGIISGNFIKFYRKENGVLYQKGGIISILFLVGGIVLKEVFITFLSHTQYLILAHGSLLIILLLGFQYAGRSLMAIYREPGIWHEYLESKNKSKT